MAFLAPDKRAFVISRELTQHFIRVLVSKDRAWAIRINSFSRCWHYTPALSRAGQTDKAATAGPESSPDRKGDWSRRPPPVRADMIQIHTRRTTTTQTARSMI